MAQTTTVGVGLAKEVMVVCAANAGGRVVYRRQLPLALKRGPAKRSRPEQWNA
jgi:hypothetical protein